MFSNALPKFDSQVATSPETRICSPLLHRSIAIVYIPPYDLAFSWAIILEAGRKVFFQIAHFASPPACFDFNPGGAAIRRAKPRASGH
jgi:hypothetical protein